MAEQTNWGELVETADGSMTLRHPEIDEEYHSSQGARFEAKTLYIEASGFKTRLGNPARGPVRVLDVGLGLGYNALTTIAAWLAEPAPPSVDLHSLEINPALAEALQSGSAPWAASWPEDWRTVAGSLTPDPVHKNKLEARLTHPQMTKTKLVWTIWLGDAAKSADWNPAAWRFDYIWQDAFSPKKNPELWTVTWFEALGRWANPGAVMMTYSVARSVRDALTASSWDWQKLAAPGKKRHWLQAIWQTEKSIPAKNTNTGQGG